MTDSYAVIGNPIRHTKSPLIHTAFARQTGQDIAYEALEAPLGGFAAVVDRFRAGGGCGLNITAPFKLDAFAYATEIKEAARCAGAVNAMKFEGDHVIADNFDGIGLVNDIQRNLDWPIKGRRVLLLGAGGAAHGALLPILEQGPAEVVIVNRTVRRAEELRDQIATRAPLFATGFAQLPHAHPGPFDLVINATSASQQDDLPPLDMGVFAPTTLAYEMVYGKGLTPFLRLAKSAGASRLADGVGMLVEQAAEAFLWWRGIRPHTRTLIEHLSVPLA